MVSASRQDFSLDIEIEYRLKGHTLREILTGKAIQKQVFRYANILQPTTSILDINPWMHPGPDEENRME